MLNTSQLDEMGSNELIISCECRWRAKCLLYEKNTFEFYRFFRLGMLSLNIHLFLPILVSPIDGNISIDKNQKIYLSAIRNSDDLRV